MKKITKIISLFTAIVMLLGFFTGCNGSGDLSKDRDAPSGFEQSMKMVVEDGEIGSEISEFGVEIYPEMFMGEPFSEDEINLLASKIRDLGIDIVRIGVNPLWYEKTNDNDDFEKVRESGFDFENNEMKAFFQAIELANKAEKKILLVVRGIPSGSWLGYDVPDSEYTAANDPYELGENVLMLVKTIIGKYSSEGNGEYDGIRYLTIQDSANTTWIRDTGACLPIYFKAVKEVSDRIGRSNEIKTKPLLITSDDKSYDTTWFKRCTQELKDISAGYSFHTEQYERGTKNSEIFEGAAARYGYVKENDSSSKMFVSSFGFKGDKPLNGEYYENDIAAASMAVTLLGAGASGIIYRSLCDFNCGGVSETGGLLNGREKGFEEKSTFGMFKMLTGNLEKGSKIYETRLYYFDFDDNFVQYDENDCCCTAVRTPEGKWTYLFNNGGNIYGQKLTLYQPETGDNISVVQYDKKGVSESDAKTEIKNGKIYINVPSSTFVIIRSE